MTSGLTWYGGGICGLGDIWQGSTSVCLRMTADSLQYVEVTKLTGRLIVKNLREG